MGSRHHEPDEVRAKYIAAMGEDLGSLFYICWNECAWLHLKWAEYLLLFGTKSERVQLLNKAAPAFFRIVQDSLWEDVLLHLCRLTDSPQSAGKDNLTVRRLPSLVREERQAEIADLVEDLQIKSEFARDWRKRHIAHHDLALALGKSAKPLERATREGVDGALAALATLLDAVEIKYTDSTTAYGALSPPGNAEALLCVLRDGVDAGRARLDRVRSGQLLPGDFDGKPPI